MYYGKWDLCQKFKVAYIENPINTILRDKK